jgi:hypothetical protein
LKAVVGTPLMATAAGEAGLLGFTAEPALRPREVEAAWLALPQPTRGEAHHREPTRAPPPAGREASRRVAECVAARFRAALERAGRTLLAPPR